MWVSLGHLATTTTGQPRRQLHDESESLLIISLSAQLIALAFSDVRAECVQLLPPKDKFTAEEGGLSRSISNSKMA